MRALPDAALPGPFSLADFSPSERRNMALYIAGLALYKFGLEAFTGSILTLATNRYDFASHQTNTPSVTFQRIGLLTGLNQALQCVGAVLVAPLVKRFAVKNVLCFAVLLFAVLSAILLVIDAATGGTFVPDRFLETHSEDDFSYYGRFSTDGMVPVYAVCGAAHGMVELVRRVIPRDLAGADVHKLRRLDALAHVFLQAAGVAGAFATGLVFIPRWGNNQSFLVTPICFGLAGLVWWFLATADFTRPPPEKPAGGEAPATRVQGYFASVVSGIVLFVKSLYVGFLILVSSRRYILLIPGYAVALYAHRYLETGIAPQMARRQLGNAGWAPILVGGSNMGELLGALSVFLLGTRVPTPIPWLRLDALLLLVVWYVPYWTPPRNQIGQAWAAAATLVPVSFGWAAGDVSLAAYVQASLSRLERREDDVSALGAVMAFLYSFYVVLYAVLGPLLGRYLDGVYDATGGSGGGGNISDGLVNTAGIQFTFIFIIVFASTFIPRGSSAFNPRMLFDDPLVDDEEEGRRPGRASTSSTERRNREMDREKRVVESVY